MANPFFQFKQFTVYHDRCAMKVTTDACLFGAWAASELNTDKNGVKDCLDIGAGTGLLSLMMAQQHNLRISAVEIDKEAADQAGENFAASPWEDRLTAINADVLKWQTAGQYDCIFSNPPFYENDLPSGRSAKNVAHHDRGLKLHQLAAVMKEKLKIGGTFFLLLPEKRAAEAEELLQGHALFIKKKVYVQQTPQHQPFRVMLRGSNKKVERIADQTIVIKSLEQGYTPAFTDLLESYYLYL